MRITLTQPVTYDACTVLLEVPVDYDDEDMPHNFPGRSGDTWRARINLHNGDIYMGDGAAFPNAKLAMHMKVCDGGIYTLQDHTGEPIATREAGVPGFFPGSHYGDYLILDIDNGKVTNWKVPTPISVTKAFQDQD